MALKRSRSVMEQSETVSIPATLGRETDLAIRQYGNLYEASTMDDSLTSAERLLLQTRLDARLELLSAVQAPEGVTLVLDTLVEGTTREIILLSPPELVAIQREDGTWARVRRDPDVHGPAAYSSEFYAEYLQGAGLPAWFFSAGHLSMRDDNNPELKHVGPEEKDPPAHASWPVNFLDQHYPTSPSMPVYHGQENAQEARRVKGHLTHSQQQMLARRYPVAMLDPETYELSIMPNGDLSFWSRRESRDAEARDNARPISQSDLFWIPESAQDRRASYVPAPLATPPSPTVAPILQPLPAAGCQDVISKSDTVEPDPAEPGLTVPKPAGSYDLWDANEVDPTNGKPDSEVDQRGKLRKSMYQTAEIGGQRITIDRSRAHVDQPEPHLFWTHGARKWLRYSRADDFDWKEKESINRLNKFREQAYNRSKNFPALRTKERRDYSSAERSFIEQSVRAALAAGKIRPLDGFDSLVGNFNQQFVQPGDEGRSKTAITGIFDRIRRDLENNNGKLSERKPRGWKQKEEAAARRSLSQSQLPAAEEQGDDAAVEQGDDVTEEALDTGEDKDEVPGDDLIAEDVCEREAGDDTQAGDGHD